MRFILLCLLFIFTKSHGQTISNDSENINKIINESLLFLEDSQKKQASGTDFFKGEWPSTLSNEAYVLFIGKKGKKAYDSNCFTTSLIHNVLAEVYLSTPTYYQIPPMLNLAIDNILLFKHDKTFKFWHVFDRPEHISRARHRKNPAKYQMSGPNNFFYRSRYINYHANIFDDADDTATAYASLLLNSKINESNRPDSIGYIFEKYRDIKRRNISWYNLMFGIGSRTQAYMTWFGEEKYASPWRWFLPKGSEPNMPYGTNDVCPLVNANVLNALALYNELNTEGVDDACLLIKRLIIKENNDKFTVYYPTEFNLEYATAKAIKQGVSCLDEITDIMVEKIIKSQQKDGSWFSEIDNNDIQATLYAVNSLLLIADYDKYNSRNAISKAIDYIIKSSKQKSQMRFWNGGVYFSGGTIVKKTHVWRSDAYTTALAIEALDKYLRMN